MLAFMQKINSKQRLLIILVTLVCAILVTALLVFNKFQAQPVPTGSIIVLPIKAPPAVGANDWQEYAQMEQVIANLGTSAQYPVLQTEDVIAMLSQASSFIQDQQAIDLERLFIVSGASLIVETTLSINDNSYQLDYRLLSAKQVKSGTIIDRSLSEANTRLAMRIQQFVDLPPSQIKGSANAWFSQPQLIQALKQIQYSELADAQTSLNELLTQTPNNLIAIRLLAELLTAQDSSEDGTGDALILAKRWLDKGIAHGVASGDSRQVARLRLTLAQLLLKKGLPELAITQLSQARTLAANSQDWLYLGYISNWSGHIYQHLNRYQNANAQYQYSLNYHQKAGYPAGQVMALNNLAELEVLQHNYSLAYKAINQSVAIVTQRDLTQLREPTFKLLAQIENKLQRIR
ncbi:hypothetical protein L2719_02135 [Shewanella schlegeliana]|uniref:Tetratricopeptide repeat protein n=1 Tax=Shewanella schlegeliana TaxID=190308 RepID=A0ABS1SZM9_9GAMM|nr:hypothetical protein [Shewanella schlegeliana]MBL4913475.1 hypothetical protein [Shewanella schlegeliana]MCL1108365.1 hypothetical protein [Shewanella schlegeliana]GIU29006.1 hypothetical protein TUM4433_17830 [Shewanella schlegeliana]